MSNFEPKLREGAVQVAVDAFLETSGYYGQRVRAAIRAYLVEAAEAATSNIVGDEWSEKVIAIVDQAHAENWGGKHRTGFCEACADAHLVAQYSVPRDKVRQRAQELLEVLPKYVGYAVYLRGEEEGFNAAEQAVGEKMSALRDELTID